MALTKEELLQLEKKAHELRHTIVETVYYAGSGHIGGALSMIDMVTLLYYKHLNLDKSNPQWEDRDRFVLSKGHAGIGFVAVLADLGYIAKEDLQTFNLTGSKLGIHLDCHQAPGVDASTGSLGHGLSIALGMGLGAKYLDKDFLTYCMLGDGECNEGSVWEAAMAMAHYRVTNVITLVDRNKAMIDGDTENVMALEPFKAKWEAFGFHTLEVNGHDFVAMDAALEAAKARQDQPSCLILDTVKGQGVSFAAGDFRWHYGAIDDELREEGHRSLDQYYEQRLAALKGV